MRVSIVTAVLDGADVIAATMQSVCAQDYPSIEHIVIDGASIDDTLGVVRRHGNRVAVVQSARDRGVYDAFNKGLRAASGDVVAFLNAGDVYAHAGVVSRLMHEFLEPELDVVYGDLDLIDADRPSVVKRRYRCGSFVPARLAAGFMPAHPTLFARRKVYEDVGPYDDSYAIAGDFEWCVRAFLKRHTRYRHVPETLVRMPAGGLSNRGLSSAVKITREMHRACAQNAIATSWLKLAMRLPIKALAEFGRGS